LDGDPDVNPLMLLLIDVMLIVLCAAMVGTAALIILMPIFVPVIMHFGIDPNHFGIVLVTKLTIAAAALTPAWAAIWLSALHSLRNSCEMLRP
jgi:TRAP-type C4-dicarboxylate transport system permease large subunit